jgi:hypothetical protein
MTRANQAVPTRDKSNESATAGPVHGRIDNSTDFDVDLVPDNEKLLNSPKERERY